jgi:hypothetical protein
LTSISIVPGGLGQPGHVGGQPEQGQAVPQDPFREYKRYYLALDQSSMHTCIFYIIVQSWCYGTYLHYETRTKQDNTLLFP